MRFLALLAMAAMVSVSFNSCNLIDDDDDPIDDDDDWFIMKNQYGGKTSSKDNVNWSELSAKSKIMNNYPEIEGNFKSCIITNGKQEGITMELVSFTCTNFVAGDYAVKLMSDDFVYSNVGGMAYGYKVDKSGEYTFEYIEGDNNECTIIFEWFELSADEYEETFNEYQEKLKSMAKVKVNCAWADFAGAYEWLSAYPAPQGIFDQCNIFEEEKGLSLIGNFDSDYQAKYIELLLAKGFSDKFGNGSMYSKVADGYEYLAYFGSDTYLFFKCNVAVE